ncbi:MAG: M28 family peptidase [Acidobacteria bacterium]|nr:M28 family peptidase [Acidobacteriota bacterium]
MGSQFVTRYAFWCSAFLFLLTYTTQAVSQQRKRQPIKRPAATKTKATPTPTPAYPPGYQTALDAISEDSLKGHLSFIAADLLEGRNTPSRGLDLAAEYIAAQFRRAGIEPAGDADVAGQPTYFQTSEWRAAETSANNANAGLVLQNGEQNLRVSANQAALQNLKVGDTVKLRNVVAILRGSDPVLKDTYVLVTAHYDHIGMLANGEDRISNGANDDGSGTVSVIELATALSKLKERPKRSIVFLTVFGEEKGMVGSRYYGKHPLFPIAKTVADVNLEHVGRTDDQEGDKTNTATLTGFDYTDVGPIFQKAGELTGIRVYKHEQNSDSFFGRSDNQALADQGVPAHTLCVAFIFPDYHRVGDHWDKINYPNLAKTNRMIALALLMMADNANAPKWNEANPKTAKYVSAWKAQTGK